MTDVVKVRGRYGTTSLELTIPAKLAEKYGIKQGDLYEVTIRDTDELKIIYTLIYKNKQ